MTLSLYSEIALDAEPVTAVIALHCELVRGSETRVVEELLPRVKRESVVLDLTDVERIDAAGIAALITLYCTAVQAGHDFSIVTPSPRVLDLLRIVGLERILMNEGRPRGNARSRINHDSNRATAVAQSAA